jgi:DNA-binding SARP family transcriptional activator
VSRLRKALNPWKRTADIDGVINSVGGAYTLRLSCDELDLLVFKDLAACAAAAWADGDHVTACELYERAVGLWRGDPLADVDLLHDHPSITFLRQHLVGVLLRYAEVACALGQYRRALPRLQALAAAEPLNEPAHARLMIALAGSGEQAAAIRVYEDLRSRLDRELGLYPGKELAEAHMRVLRQDIRAGTQGEHARTRLSRPPRIWSPGSCLPPRSISWAGPTSLRRCPACWNGIQRKRAAS